LTAFGEPSLFVVGRPPCAIENAEVTRGARRPQHRQALERAAALIGSSASNVSAQRGQWYS
jgi:hypothetical protein